MMINDDNKDYMRFTGPMRLDKEIHTISGLLRGIQIDGIIEKREIAAVRAWMRDNARFKNQHPFDEIWSSLEEALLDDVLESEEIEDVLWLCESLTKNNRYFDKVTSDMQRLQGILGGIISDGKITEDELLGLSDWMEKNDHLRCCWPYDEIEAIVLDVMKDGKIDKQEHEALLKFFFEFTNTLSHRALDIPDNWDVSDIQGVCAVCPEIEFQNSTFCFTGKSKQSTRADLESLIDSLGGIFSKRLVVATDYLIIGADGNPCWAYACYGRKVEAAIELRKRGEKILLVHENDFWDSVADVG